MSRELPQDLQNKIRNFQSIQANLQQFNERKLSLEAQLKEVQSALEFIEKADKNTTIFKSLGGLMVETTNEQSIADLKETQELLNANLKKTNMMIERQQKTYDTMKEEINNSLKARLG